MDELITVLVQAAPATAGVVVVVLLFLRYLTKRDDTLAQIGDGCHAVQHESTEAIRECSNQLGRNTEIVERVADHLARLEMNMEMRK